MRSRLRSKIGVLAVLGGSICGGCSHPVHVGSSRLVAIALTEYRVHPDDLIAPAGSLTFQVRNDGQLSHNLVVATGTDVVASTRAIPPGQTATISVVLPPGRYSVFSSIQSDETLGERGTLLVTGGSGRPTAN